MWVLVIAAVTAVVLLVRGWRSGRKLVEYYGIGFWYLYARLWHRWACDKEAPLPPDGPAILVSNHTCSADPSFLTAGSSRVLSFMVAREYYHIPLVRRLLAYMRCVPVARTGRDASSVRAALRCLGEGRVVCIFPEGGLGNAGKPTALRAGKSGTALIALRSRAPVYPALITDGPQTCEILPAWLGPSRVRVTFGPALDLSAYLGPPINRKLIEEVNRFIMRQIAALEPRALANRHAPSRV